MIKQFAKYELSWKCVSEMRLYFCFAIVNRLQEARQTAQEEMLEEVEKAKKDAELKIADLEKLMVKYWHTCELVYYSSVNGHFIKQQK